MARINFDLHQLQAFVAVAESGNFRSAADQLHLSQPALSRRIERLESILGSRLFHRTTRKVELTALGRLFLERARAALDDLETAMLGITDIATSYSGRVSVACVPSAALHFLPHAIAMFVEQYPAMRVQVIDGAMNDVLRGVTSGDADFGIGFMSARIPEISFQPIYTDDMVVAMRREHGLAKRRKLDWKDLVHERLMAVSRGSGNRQLLDNALATAKLNLTFAVEVSHVATLIGMVEEGMGLAFVPRMIVPESHPDIVGIPLASTRIERKLGILTRQGAPLKPAAEVFRKGLFAALPKAGRLRGAR